jgi:anti-anti-sigma factor
MQNDNYTVNNDFVIKLHDEFDAELVKSMRDELEAFSQLSTNIVVDLNDVKFIDSSGIGAIVFLYKRLLAKDFNLSVVGLGTQPSELFKMLMLDQTINCYQTMESYLSNTTTVKVAS